MAEHPEHGLDGAGAADNRGIPGSGEAGREAGAADDGVYRQAIPPGTGISCRQALVIPLAQSG